MAPNVTVPMNFGIRLLDSPTHSTLQLKASQGAVIPASSVILSFNSPVIDHMTTTLHLTSVDMEEFSEDAVRYFVDAAYSGESPPISRVLFRDINKLANVFEMSWLVTRCVKEFSDIAAAIHDNSYNHGLLFLFDEAEFVLTNLKSREMVEIALTKIQSLNGQQDFIRRYLENINSLSCQQLDLIIELAGTKVEFVVKPLTEQLTASLSKGLPLNCKYILENCDLCLCQQNNNSVFVQLFDELQKITDESLSDSKWIFQLYRKSSEKRGIVQIALDSTSTDILEDSNDLLNFIHKLDCSMTFDQVVNWLGKSEQVTNLMMFFEGLWTWMWVNENAQVDCTTHFLDKVHAIKKNRNWNSFSGRWSLYVKNLNCNADQFFKTMRMDVQLCSNYNKWRIEMGYQVQPNAISHNIFTSATKLMFYFKISARYCSKSGKCGIIVKTVPAKGGANMILCTDPSDYSEEIHYHDEVDAKDMHFLVKCKNRNDHFIPLSWLGGPVSKNGQLILNLLDAPPLMNEECCTFYILLKQ